MIYLLIAAIWWLAFPAAGLLLVLLTWSWPYAVRGPLVICRMSRILKWITSKIIRFDPSAFTWCCWMFTWQDGSNTERTVKHEGNHAFWALVLGLGYPMAYLGGALAAVATGGHWYRDNFWERLAVKAESK